MIISQYVERNVHYRNNWKSQNRKIDRKSGDTTVRMTADDIINYHNLVPMMEPQPR